MMKGQQNPLSNLCMLNLTQYNNLMAEFQTPEFILQVVCISEIQKAHLWITTTHNTGSPINQGG